MASYTELYGLWSNADLRNKVAVACIVAADMIRTEDVGTTNHANRLIWAKVALASPASQADTMLMAILAQNKALTVTAILGAADSALQTAVNNAVNILATG